MQLIASPEGDQRRQQLRRHAQLWRDSLSRAGWPRPAGVGPIVALKLGDDSRALEAANRAIAELKAKEALERELRAGDA